MKPIYHALVLNLHQPAGNLEHLLEHSPWEAREILFALDRIARSNWAFGDKARVHLSLSGTLLETLSSPDFQSRVYGDVDVGSMLWHLQNQYIIQILGTGYYHPVLPLIPVPDRLEHIRRWQGIARHLFGREHFSGFWPPEMGFSMDLIPLLSDAGYRYVLVDSEHLEPVDEMDWPDLRYRPHIARHDGHEIIVVVRDRELSDAQESGMETEWFLREVAERTRWCDFVPLVTTATDGDNGGWFRNTTEGANFWSAFYQPLMQQARDGGRVQPTFIDDYIAQHGVGGEVRVRTGAWNTGWHHGRGFVQWTGSADQREVVRRIAETSARLHPLRWQIGEQHGHDPALQQLAEQAMWHLLRSETSCNIYWGTAWVDRAHDDLDRAWSFINELEAKL
jgi:alpha-amylase/alpha-mannosidase (GH57 family)